MRQRYDMLVRLWLPDKRYHLQDVVVEHQNDERSSLAEEDWIWRFFLVVEDFLADIATTYNFNLVLTFVIAD